MMFSHWKTGAGRKRRMDTREPTFHKLYFKFEDSQAGFVEKFKAAVIAKGQSLDDWFRAAMESYMEEYEARRIVSGPQLKDYLRKKHKRSLEREYLYKLRTERWTEGVHYFSSEGGQGGARFSYDLDKVLPDLLETGLGKRKYRKELQAEKDAQMAREEEEKLAGNPVVRFGRRY